MIARIIIVQLSCLINRLTWLQWSKTIIKSETKEEGAERNCNYIQDQTFIRLWNKITISLVSSRIPRKNLCKSKLINLLYYFNGIRNTFYYKSREIQAIVSVSITQTGLFITSYEYEFSFLFIFIYSFNLHNFRKSLRVIEFR